MRGFFFPGAMTLCWYWLRNSTFLRGGVIVPTLNTEPGQPGSHFLWSLPFDLFGIVALQKACAPASIALRVTGGCQRPLYDKAVVLEGACDNHSSQFCHLRAFQHMIAASVTSYVPEN